jgi:UDP-2,4-diacetamido-2,4,6-trideoxy-beta-L-altropyranose hydrolase
MKICLKKAKFSDIEFLWYLRSQPDVYKYSRQNRPVGWQEHIGWIMPVILGMTEKNLFIIRQKLIPMGHVRLDYKQDNEAEISIAVLKEFRGKGVGLESFKEAVKLLKSEKKIKTITAEVHKDNAVSQKFFERLNFKLKEKKGSWLKYILNL